MVSVLADGLDEDKVLELLRTEGQLWQIGGQAFAGWGRLFVSVKCLEKLQRKGLVKRTLVSSNPFGMDHVKWELT